MTTQDKQDIRIIMQEELGGVHAKIGSLESTIHSLDSRVGSLGSKVNSLDSKVDTLVVKVSTLSDEMVELKTETRRNSVLIEHLDYRISAIAENVSDSLENQMRINDLDKRLVVVEHLNGITT